MVGNHQRGPTDPLPALSLMSRRKTSTAFIATVSFSGTLRMRLDRPLTAAEVGDVAGIHRLPGREKDCFVRLNTGCFDLEMCREPPEAWFIQVGTAPFSLSAGQRRAASFRE